MDIIPKNSKSFNAFLKSPFKSLKHSTYFNVYDEILSRYIGEPITFVEVGVLQGGSLFMWREFFGDKARIIGIDLNPNALKWKEHGFEIYIGDQSQEKFWKSFYTEIGNIDILLDDGGHTYDQQIVTLTSSLPYISNGGTIIIEDTHTSYMSGFGPKKYSLHRFAFKLVDSINDRYSKFNTLNNSYKNNIWNIQFFESIVTFQINREKCMLSSFEIENKGRSDIKAKDFRYNNLKIRKSLVGFQKIKNYIPQKIKIRILKVIASKESKARKYFKNL